jgi:transcriptional regulator CtsR
MAQLSDTIERFIKQLMEEDAYIEVRRNELAQHFRCAPSQINYVLATRFSVEHGYIIESRRGGGGYVRIVRMKADTGENVLHQLLVRIGGEIAEDGALAIIAYLLDNALVTDNEAKIMRAAVMKDAMGLPVNAKDVLRSAVLRNMVMQVFRNLEGREGA